MNKTYIPFLLMLFNSICLSISPLIWKLMPDYKITYLLSGFLLLGIGSIAMLLAYRFGELSVLQPINSVSYIFSTLIAVFILKENISLIKIAGIVLIIGGVFVISFKSK